MGTPTLKSALVIALGWCCAGWPLYVLFILYKAEESGILFRSLFHPGRMEI